MLQDVLPVLLHALMHSLESHNLRSAYSWLAGLLDRLRLMSFDMVKIITFLPSSENEHPWWSIRKCENSFLLFKPMYFDEMHDFHVAKILRRWNYIFPVRNLSNLCISYCRGRSSSCFLFLLSSLFPLDLRGNYSIEFIVQTFIIPVYE